jgi:hypothetical protein
MIVDNVFTFVVKLGEVEKKETKNLDYVSSKKRFDCFSRFFKIPLDLWIVIIVIHR